MVLAVQDTDLHYKCCSQCIDSNLELLTTKPFKFWNSTLPLNPLLLVFSNVRDIKSSIFLSST